VLNIEITVFAYTDKG